LIYFLVLSSNFVFSFFEQFLDGHKKYCTRKEQLMKNQLEKFEGKYDKY
jgi:hypothetical protein